MTHAIFGRSTAFAGGGVRFSLSLLGLLAAGSLHAASLHAVRLRCEYLEDPLGIDAAKPRLSWIVESSARAQSQAAYRILVASTADKLRADQGDLWDSSRVLSDETIQIAYGGKPLGSGERCFWKVRVWDASGHVSRWSEVASWEMGLLAPTDWQAKWIGRTADTNSNPAPLLRREFRVRGPVRQARAYVCGLGYYELRLNGQRVGDHILDPGYTRYDKRVLYVTYDVTHELRIGWNALGAILGNGWYNVHTRAVWNFHRAPWRAAPKLLLQLRIDYADGTAETIVSDEGWHTATGPIVFDSIYGGETYDARLERPGWETASYHEDNWQPALVVEPPAGRLVAQTMPPIKIDRAVMPIRVTEPRPGVFVFDLGQNLAGFAALTVSGPAGTKVVMRYGERLNPDGMLDPRDLEQHVKSQDQDQQFQTDTYVLKGTGTEHWHARFCYHGFQYVEVTGFPGKPTAENLRGLFVHSAVPGAGRFECSDSLLNRVQRNTLWSFLSNFQGIPTDCPHREKNGWTGDAHLAAEQAMFNFFPAPVHTKWINDLGDEQRPTGELPGIVPTSGWGYEWGNGPAWDSAFVLIPYYLYVYYGDTEVLRRQYAGLRRYVDYLSLKAQDGIVSIGLNDWAPFDTQTAAPITSTAYYHVDARIVALAAKLSGRPDDARKYAELAEHIKQAFNARFYRPRTGLYDNGSQTALSCALYQGLVEPPNRALVLANLVAAVENRNGHLDTGILGAKYLLNALLENDRTDVAYRIVTQRDLPSWGWWIDQGASTLWEQWRGTDSRNHIMFGDVSAWFYKALAGIRPDPEAPGFKHFEIKPYAPDGLLAARAEYDSIRGRIVSAWSMAGGQFRFHLEVPANTTATVYLPAASADAVREAGQLARLAQGVRLLRTEPHATVFLVGSGKYDFVVPRK